MPVVRPVAHIVVADGARRELCSCSALRDFDLPDLAALFSSAGAALNFDMAAIVADYFSRLGWFGAAF